MTTSNPDCRSTVPTVLSAVPCSGVNTILARRAAGCSDCATFSATYASCTRGGTGDSSPLALAAA